LGSSKRNIVKHLRNSHLRVAYPPYKDIVWQKFLDMK
jgi:hypothetical protein